MIEVAGSPVPDGQPVVAKRGDLVRVQLDENGTTGYQWSVAQVDDALRIESNVFVPPRSDAMGAAGQRVLSVRALGEEGDARLVLRLGRSWEPQPIDERVIGIRMEPGSEGP